ncbi:MAG: polyphosphate kinase 1 [Coriobacteriaceae bacterium]|nr:polyphosphate kinase 1 [Coriobacteriaceae bacterium]
MGSDGHGTTRDITYTQNRELSWLRFDERVLAESLDESVPLFERLKFIAIFESNMHEFLMVRMGGLSSLATLKRQPRDNRSGMTPSEQVEAVFAELPGLFGKAASSLQGIEAQLRAAGIERVEPSELIGAERDSVRSYFTRNVLPIFSPLVIDPRHPFPNLRNGALYVVCTLAAASDDEQGLLGIIEVPASLPRVVEISHKEGRFRYILLEDVILACLDSCFGSYAPQDRAVIRVTRNADLDPDGEGVEEDEDYRQHMKKVLKKRLRLKPVLLAIHGDLNRGAVKTVRKALHLSQQATLHVDMPLDLGYIYSLEPKLPAPGRDKLLFSPFSPQPSPLFAPSIPMSSQVFAGDKLLFYPYESMSTLLDLMNEAAHDDACISIRITLYRVARQSRLCESLISAAESGKEVTVLMELRARFDEENNIAWAERLEEAGCTVIYGTEGFKCHSKICQLTYHSEGRIRRITLLGTGNFNEKTARLYSDFMLMTAHEGIGEDANAFFRNLTLGNLHGDYRYLGVAPAGLKPLVMGGLDREISRARSGMPARALFKMNSLTDREVIDKIAEASCAGVRVDMVIRGISCLLPGVEGRTENVHIRSIVGRFLEHARVYAFGEEADTIYLSSADMMTRNTEHRVEIAFPVLDPGCRKMVREYMADQLRDNVKARLLDRTGAWIPVPLREGDGPFNAQEHLMAQAIERAHAAEAALQPAGSGVDVGRIAGATMVDCGNRGASGNQKMQGSPSSCDNRRADDGYSSCGTQNPTRVQGAIGESRPYGTSSPDATSSPDGDRFHDDSQSIEVIPQMLIPVEGRHPERNQHVRRGFSLILSGIREIFS